MRSRTIPKALILAIVFVLSAWRGACADMKDVEDFVESAVNSTQLPVDLDQQLPRLREFCFSPEGEKYRQRTRANPSVLAGALWVLLRYEYAGLFATMSRSPGGGRRRSEAAAWRLDHVAQRFASVTLEKGLASEESWAFRRAQAQVYQNEARAMLALPLSPSDVEDLVKQELAGTFTPAATNDVNRQIQSSFRGLVQSVEQTSQYAAEARLQAIGSLREIYGANPDIHRKKNEQHLSETERGLIYQDARYKKIKSMLEELLGKELTSAVPAEKPAEKKASPDTSLVGSYAELREQLGLKDRSVTGIVPTGRPSPDVVEGFFGNDQRETAPEPAPSVDGIRKLVGQALERQLTNPLEDPGTIDGYGKATRDLKGELQRTAGVIGTTTGEREKLQMQSLASTYPPLSGDAGLLNETVPWFTVLPEKDLAKTYEAVKGWIADTVTTASTKDALVRDRDRAKDKFGITTETAEALLADLVRQLSKK